MRHFDHMICRFLRKTITGTNDSIQYDFSLLYRFLVFRHIILLRIYINLLSALK